MTDRPLPSWRDAPARQAIVELVAVAAAELPPAERIAVFDNDGTLWCEKPLPVQADFVFRRLAEQAAADPSLRQRQPWLAVLEQDRSWLEGAIVKHYQGDDGDLHTMAAGVLGAYDGTAVEEFQALAAAFLRDAVHPTLGRSYLRTAYGPMVELIGYLHAHGFTCYIATGGGRDFVRAAGEELYGIPAERVIGSTVALRYEDGRVVHTSTLDVFDDGPEKPVRIWSRIGRRPILAAGNANGDVPMLSWTAAHTPSLSLLIEHDDAEREFAYTDGADTALDRAAQQGWTVVSMQDDWTRIFAD